MYDLVLIAVIACILAYFSSPSTRSRLSDNPFPDPVPLPDGQVVDIVRLDNSGIVTKPTLQDATLTPNNMVIMSSTDSLAVWQSNAYNLGEMSFSITLTLSNIVFDSIKLAIGPDTPVVDDSGLLIKITHNKRKAHFNILASAKGVKKGIHVSDSVPNITLTFDQVWNYWVKSVTVGDQTIILNEFMLMTGHVVLAAEVQHGYLAVSNLSYTATTPFSEHPPSASTS